MHCSTLNKYTMNYQTEKMSNERVYVTQNIQMNNTVHQDHDQVTHSETFSTSFE